MSREIRATPESVEGAVERILEANYRLVELIEAYQSGSVAVRGSLAPTIHILQESVKNLNQVGWALELTLDTLEGNTIIDAGPVKTDEEIH